MKKISLAAARVNANLTQGELAEKLGVSRATVNLCEKGKKKVRKSYFYALCQITGFEPEDIFLPYELGKTEQDEN